jgi:hypothetical protein
MKLTKAIFGAADGEIYPREYGAGEDCPPELLAAAIEAGAISEDDIAAEAEALAKAEAEAAAKAEAEAKAEAKAKK